VENMSEYYEDDEFNLTEPYTKGFEDDLCNKEIIIEAMKTITKAHELTAFKMRYINELTIQQIADALNEKESVVKNWVYRTRDKIYSYLINNNIKL
jgi:DNA-directed RNA polymerase specialized sigma24 family protein